MVGRLERSLELLTGGARDLPARQQTLAGDARLELRAARSGARGAVRAARRLPRRLDAGSRRSGRSDATSSTDLGTLVDESLRPPGRVAVHDARDDSRVRVARLLESEAQDAPAAARGALPAARRGRSRRRCRRRSDRRADAGRARRRARQLSRRARLGRSRPARSSGEVRLAAALRHYWIDARRASPRHGASSRASIERSANAEPRLRRARARSHGGGLPATGKAMSSESKRSGRPRSSSTSSSATRARRPLPRRALARSHTSRAISTGAATSTRSRLEHFDASGRRCACVSRSATSARSRACAAISRRRRGTRRR